MLIDIQDDIAPLFTDSIHNEASSNKVKYEIIVVLHNLLCINTDNRVRKEFVGKMKPDAIGFLPVCHSIQELSPQAMTSIHCF